MKKLLIVLLIFVNAVFISCSSITLNLTKTTGNKERLTSSLGEIEVLTFAHINDETEYLNTLLINEQTRDKTTTDQLHKGWTLEEIKKNYEPYRFFFLVFNHKKVYKFAKDDDLKFSMTDSAGTTIKAVKYLVMDYKAILTRSSDGAHYRDLFIKKWIWKTDLPVTKQNFKSPITVTTKLFNDFEITFTGEIPDK